MEGSELGRRSFNVRKMGAYSLTSEVPLPAFA